MNLIDYLKAASARQFRYGRHDCCTMAASWVQMVTGKDVLEGHHYSSLREGRALLEAHGMASHADVFARHLPRAPVLSLVAGDVAVIDGDSADALGIVMPGGERVFCFERSCTATVALTACKYGFKVRA